MSRVKLLADDEIEDYEGLMEPIKQRLGFVPNSQRSMAHKPELLRAYGELGQAVMNQTEGSISRALKYMIANAASLTAGCMYCIAHTGEGRGDLGIRDQRPFHRGRTLRAALRAGRGGSAQHGDRRGLRRSAQALYRVPDRRDRRRDFHVRLSQPVERHAGHGP